MSTSPAYCANLIKTEADISGRGVRISIYIEVICVCLSAICSRSYKKLVPSALTLAVTVIAYSASALILGLGDSPELTLYDGLMASYLSSLPIGAYALIVVLCMMRRTVHVAFAVGTLAIQYFYAAAIIAIKYYAPRFGTNPECFRELYLPFEGLQNLDTYRTRSLVFSYVGLGVIVVESFVIGFLCWWWARKPATEPPSALDMNLAKSGKGAGSDIEEGSGVNGVWSSGPQEGAVKPTPQKHDEVPSTEESRPPTGHQCTCACGHKWVPGDVEPLDSKKGEGLLLGFDFIFVLICTTVVYVVLVVRIEIFRMQNRDLLGQPAEEWTLGQILAVALAIPPVFETLRIMWSYFRRVRDPNVKFFNRKSIILSSLKDAFKFIVGRVRAAI